MAISRGIKMKPASGAGRSYSKTDFCTKMSETLSTRCEVSEEISVMNSHVLSLSFSRS